MPITYPPSPDSLPERVPDVSVSLHSPASPSRQEPVPLLSLAPPALALGDHLEVGKPGDENNVGEIWNVIARASDLVKDGQRLENLAWRVWGSETTSTPRRCRRYSTSTQGTGSSTSLHTPSHEQFPPSSPFRPHHDRHSTFGSKLNLLVEGDNFRDWVSDAKRALPPILSVPDTPVANLEIRLVEPTPVPSRVGSLGGSMNPAGLLASAAVPPRLAEEDAEDGIEEEDEPESPAATCPNGTSPPSTAKRSPRKKGGKFFLHSSPSKGGSGSDTVPSPADPRTKPSQPIMPPRIQRHSSGSSSSIPKLKPRDKKFDLKEKRNVSLSTMRGKFHAEKRKVHAALEESKAAQAQAEQEEQDAQDEGSGWEDEDEQAGEAPEPEAEEDWSDEESQAPESKEPEQPSKHRRHSSRSSNGASGHELTRLLSRQTSRKSGSDTNTKSRDPPPPPAPTPLKRMSKKQREAAAADRARIEVELEAQRQREMFSKKQVVNGSRASEGLLTGLFRRGGSLVDLPGAQNHIAPLLRASGTHDNLTSLRSSLGQGLPSHPPNHHPHPHPHPHAHPGPTILRSKSAAALPVQTGVSVTVGPHTPLHDNNEHSSVERHSKGSHGSKVGESDDSRLAFKSAAKKPRQQRAPADVALESSDDEASEDDYLATSQTRRKLAELDAKKASKDAMGTTAPAPQVGFEGANGVVVPMSPTSRRRAMITREMSESLRKNLILERQKSSTGTGLRVAFAPHTRPPPLVTRRTGMSTHNSATDLKDYQYGHPLERKTSLPPDLQLPPKLVPPLQTPQEREGRPSQKYYHPLLQGMAHPQPHPSSRSQPQEPTQQVYYPQPPLSADPIRRQNRHTVLSGFLRPLSRVGDNPTISRTHSSAELTVSPTNIGGRPVGESTPMVRSNTDGDKGKYMEERDLQRRELQRRSETMDTGYRYHGW